VGRLEQTVHLRRQPRRDIPVVRFGQDARSAPQRNPPVPDLGIGSDLEAATLVRRGRLLHACDAVGDDARIVGEVVIAAPALERLRRAAAREELRVERLCLRERIDPSRQPLRGRRQGKDQRRSGARHRGLGAPWPGYTIVAPASRSRCQLADNASAFAGSAIDIGVRSPVNAAPESSTTDTLSPEWPGVGTIWPSMPSAASLARLSSKAITTFPALVISV